VARPLIGYEIREGVRRAVAAREAGKPDIPALIIEPGTAVRLESIPLTELYSPRSETPRDFRYIRDVEYPTLILGSEPPPIRVHPIRSTKRASYLTPLASVKLV
jgi:hypothetical protein